MSNITADAGAAATAGIPGQSSFTLDNTLGAIVVGFAASCVVYGILLTQAWAYFKRFTGDSVVYKGLVVMILILETTDQAFIGQFVYFYTVTSIGNPFAIATGTMTWSIILQQAIGSVVGTIVKCCFASRVYRFSERNVFVTGFIVLLSLGQLGVALVFTIEAFGLSSIPAVFRLKTLATISLGLGAGTDIVTAASLSFFLWRMRTGYKPADSLVARLVVDAINTGILTTAVSLSTLLLFDFYDGNLIFAATYFLLAKLYAISFLATLNTRRSVRGRGTDAEGGTSGYPTDRGFPAIGGTGGGGSRRTGGRSAHEETNIFHLGTRVPSMHEDGAYAYSFSTKDADLDVKPGYPPEVAYGYLQQQPHAF